MWSSHGRDHKLCVWKFSARDEEFLDKTLPVDRKEGESHPSQPWLVYSLSVNALNFCAFSMAFLDMSSRMDVSRAVLIAVPNALNSGAIDMFHLPLEKRVSTVPAPMDCQTGMVMAANVFFSLGDLYVCAGYEDGHVVVFVCRGQKLDIEHGIDPRKWKTVYSSRPHTQPVLGLDVAPSKDRFYASAADAFLGVHPIPSSNTILDSPLKVINSGHAGQQGLRVRSDGKVFATAGWDSRMRVYSCKTMKELAVLKWHSEGCFAVCFADVEVQEEQQQAVTKRELSLATVQQQRCQKVQNTHWLVAGSKDGKISLWDIY